MKNQFEQEPHPMTTPYEVWLASLSSAERSTNSEAALRRRYVEVMTEQRIMAREEVSR